MQHIHALLLLALVPVVAVVAHNCYILNCSVDGKYNHIAGYILARSWVLVSEESTSCFLVKPVAFNAVWIAKVR